MMHQLASRASLGNHFSLPPSRNFGEESTPRRNRRGMGNTPTTNQIVGASTAAVTPVATALLAPTVAATLGIAASAAIPIIGAAVAAVGFAIEAILNSGCGSTCIVTSNWANQAEAQLQQNIEAYFAIPAPRPKSAQQAAIANFMSVWNYLVQQCSNPQLGVAGQNCIQDRQAGSCKWKQPASSVPPWGAPPAGACWNWWSGYRDPIANDANVYDDGGVISQATSEASTSINSILSNITASTGISSNSLLLIAAGFLLVMGMAGGRG